MCPLQLPLAVQLDEVVPFQQHSFAEHDDPLVFTVLTELAISGPFVSPTLYFVTQRFFPPLPLYAAGMYRALYLSQSACEVGAPPDVESYAPPPPPAPEPERYDTIIFFIELVIVRVFVWELPIVGFEVSIFCP